MNVSVVIPTYNMANTLPRAIESVLKQTLQDFSVIVVDDASTDMTAEVVRKYDDPRIVYVRHETNRGGSAAVETGIVKSSAPLIAGLDADDVVRPDWLKVLSRTFAEPSVGMAWGGIALRREDGTLYSMAVRSPWDTDEPASPMPVMLTWTPGAGGVMYRKAMLDQVGFLDPEISMGDLEFSIRLASSGKWKVRVVPEIVMDVYRRPGSLSGKVDSHYFASLERILDKHAGLWEEHPDACAYYHYRAARAAFELGQVKAGFGHLDRAVEAEPANRKYRWYRLIRRLRLQSIWHGLSYLRAKTDEKRRMKKLEARERES